jgi:hypothetical protein
MTDEETHPAEWLQLTTRWGDEFFDPTEEQLWSALREFDDLGEGVQARLPWENEAAVAWRDGTHIWYVSANVDGSVVFGEAEYGAEYELPHAVSRERVMELWRLLIEHRLGDLRREDWRPRTYPTS